MGAVLNSFIEDRTMTFGRKVTDTTLRRLLELLLSLLYRYGNFTTTKGINLSETETREKRSTGISLKKTFRFREGM